MRKLKYRDPNNPEDMKEAREKSKHPETGTETRVQQQFKDETDINVIMDRFGVTDGSMPPMAKGPGYFGDFTDAADFRQQLDATKEAVDKFDALPAKIRHRFNNTPAEFYEWVSTADNHEEAVRLGILQKQEAPKPPEPLAVRVVPDTSQTGTATPSAPAKPADQPTKT